MAPSAEGRSALDVGNVIAAFSAEQVQNLTGLNAGRLRYWDKTDFFRPSHAGEGEPPYGRFYSFKDVVALRTLELLRVQNNVSLQHLRMVAENLAHLKNDLWISTILYVINRKVAIANPETGRPQEVVSGQHVLGIPLEKIMEETRADIQKMRIRTDQQIGRISQSRRVMRNSPVLSGTRIPVEAVRRLHADGYTDAQIIDEYPDLTAADVTAALTNGDKRAA